MLIVSLAAILSSVQCESVQIFFLKKDPVTETQVEIEDGAYDFDRDGYLPQLIKADGKLTLKLNISSWKPLANTSHRYEASPSDVRATWMTHDITAVYDVKILMNLDDGAEIAANLDSCDNCPGPKLSVSEPHTQYFLKNHEPFGNPYPYFYSLKSADGKKELTGLMKCTCDLSSLTDCFRSPGGSARSP
jgi:hypothetical protein